MAKGKKALGLGDTLEAITEATGIKAVVEKVKEVTGWDCGCDARKETLNRLFPYVKPNCLTEDNYNYLSNLFIKNLNEISINQQYELIDIYLQVFGSKLEHSNCSSCWRDRINELRKVYDTHKEDANTETKE
jgi:hypothetical protein